MRRRRLKDVVTLKLGAYTVLVTRATGDSPLHTVRGRFTNYPESVGGRAGVGHSVRGHEGTRSLPESTRVPTPKPRLWYSDNKEGNGYTHTLRGPFLWGVGDP